MTAGTWQRLSPGPARMKIVSGCLALIAAAGCRLSGDLRRPGPPAEEQRENPGTDGAASPGGRPGPSDAGTPWKTAHGPFLNLRDRPLEYPGPGRDEPEPKGVTEVAIGWFGPSDPEDELTGGMWLAASLAVEEANEAGGYRGLPFRLVPRWSRSPWGNGASLVARMAYIDRVWGIIGAVDGPTTHLAEQVVAKACLPLVSPASTDKSVNLAGVSWAFSCAPGDHMWAPLLVDDVLRRLGDRDRRFALFRATDHDSRMMAREILQAFAGRNVWPSLELDLRPGSEEFTKHLDALERLAPGAAIVVAGPEDSARFLRSLRGRAFRCLLFGTPRMGRTAFPGLAGSAAEGVRFPLLCDLGGGNPLARAFSRRFEDRAGSAPDYAAAFTYDATRILIAAIRRGGLNRARIRDAIAGLSPWPGVTGPVRWDPVGQNRTAVLTMAAIRGGRICPERPPVARR